MSDLTVDLMEELYSADKILVENVTWEQNNHRQDRYSTQAEVHVLDGEETLEIQGQIWKTGYSFCLRYDNTVIRLWDFNDHHPGISGGHKHRYPHWDAIEEDPYGVDDVSTSDVNQAIIDFLDECAINRNEMMIQEVTELSHYA